MTRDQLRQVQAYLKEKGWYPGKTDGLWGNLSVEALKTAQRSWKRRGLYSAIIDGQWGNFSLNAARADGFEGFAEPDPLGLPVVASDRPLLGAARERAFGGPFRWIAAPVAGNRENITVLDNWASQNLETVVVPGLEIATPRGKYRRMTFNKRLVPQLIALWDEWKRTGLLDKYLIEYNGSYVARLIRGSSTSLSNHAYGSAFDINATWNGLGRPPASIGSRGTILPLIDIARKHGFINGRVFSRPDGMHFEVNRIVD